MSLDIDVLGATMIDSARRAVGNRWLDIRAIAEVELRRLAASVIDIEGLLREEHITRERAQEMLRMHQVAVQTVIAGTKGFGVQTGREIVRSALGAAGTLVNSAIGFRLI